MRLVVDLQACETDSRSRGIGRYAMSLVTAIAESLGNADDLVIAIDMADTQRARDVRNDLRCRRVQAKVVAYGYPTTQHTDASQAAKQLAGQLRSRFFASLHPDALLIPTFFETGTPYCMELDWSALAGIVTAAIGHDVIPLHFWDHYLAKGDFFSHWYLPRLQEFRNFDLILANSESTRRDLVDMARFEDCHVAVIGGGFDQVLADHCDEDEAHECLNMLGVTKPFVLMVGNGDWRKNTVGALDAFSRLPEVLRSSHQLVLTQVGDYVHEALAGQYAYVRDQVRVLGRVDDATLALLYRECKVFYFPSYYEGFGLPVLEALAFNAPVLSSNAGALPEVIHDPRALFDPSQPGDGADLLRRSLEDDGFREELRHGAREHALTFTWQRTAQKALDALRTVAARKPDRASTDGVRREWPAQDDIKLMVDACVEAGERGDLALENGLRAIARGGKRRVLVDISEVVRFDARTGIQRVTRRFFEGLATVARESGAFEVEPVCWTDRGVCYARKFARKHLAVPCDGPDAPVRILPSDLVFMLDSSWGMPERFDSFHARVQAAGGEVLWMVYDLIPIRFPETCDPGMPPAFKGWLTHAISTADGFICISEATRNDLEIFMDDVLGTQTRHPWTTSVHLGCDLDPAANSHPSAKGKALLTEIGARPYFTVLGTLEPRKDHKTVIDAFDQLWANGVDAVLVLIGKQGWNVDHLVARIQQHPERERRLFWVQGASDGDLRYLLEGSAALIQASIWEGFGLPLIEAGSLGVPLLVSDIAVFHEIAGDGAVYFPVGDAAALSESVVSRINAGSVREPLNIRCRNWREASQELGAALLQSSLPAEQTNTSSAEVIQPGAPV